MKHLKLLVILAAGVVVACSQGGGVAVKDLAATSALYTQQCSSCHGPKGEGGIGANLKTGLPMSRSVDDLVKHINTGAGMMPAFKDKLSAEQISELAKYVYKEIQGRQ